MSIPSTIAHETGRAAVPVIAIDGPTASGKGTVAHAVAQVLGWQVLDSGALYRLTAKAALDEGIDFTNEPALGALARRLDVRFDGDAVWLAGREVAEAIRQEAIGNAASRVASLKQVRAALLERQRAFRRAPGLVADGRDMGTIVFPDASLKIFLVADVRARAERRCKQLIDKGIPANLSDLLRDMRERDARDSERAVAPLTSAEDAHLLDSSELSVEQTVDAILAKWRALNHSKS
jgi:cytidylate kinase